MYVLAQGKDKEGKACHQELCRWAYVYDHAAAHILIWQELTQWKSLGLPPAVALGKAWPYNRWMNVSHSYASRIHRFSFFFIFSLSLATGERGMMASEEKRNEERQFLLHLCGVRAMNQRFPRKPLHGPTPTNMWRNWTLAPLLSYESLLTWPFLLIFVGPGYRFIKKER